MASDFGLGGGGTPLAKGVKEVYGVPGVSKLAKEVRRMPITWIVGALFIGEGLRPNSWLGRNVWRKFK